MVPVLWRCTALYRLCRYVISLTEVLHLPRLFGSAQSSRARTSSCLRGDLSVGWGVFLMNGLMWVAVFAVKICFEFYLIAKPLVGPVRRRGGAGCGRGEGGAGRARAGALPLVVWKARQLQGSSWTR